MISESNPLYYALRSASRQWLSVAVMLSFLLAAVAQASEAPRAIYHALGVTEISGTPLRVVTLFQGATDTAAALGVTPVGVVDSWTEKPTYKYLRPALRGVAHVGLETQPSLEDIALLKPDLIVASRFRHEKIYGLLSQIAPTVALEEVFEFKKTLQVMGTALNRQAQTERLLTQWRQRVTTLRQRLATRFGANWPLSVAVLEFRADHLRSYLPASFAGSVLSEVGFVWPRPDAYQQGVMQKLTTKESMPVVDAGLFFIFMRSDQPAVAKNYQDWRAHPLWLRMQAPRQQRIYQVDGVAWSLSGGILGANNILDDIEQQFAGAAR
ncbi:MULTISPECIES: ABC transporter substrate-binding protein [unclassified Brenneria]|uniref:ABC transporter substrate-binding protein n=1 Tax=unclassified Brenneria TaxID=2634434 RepID=UPI001F276427|nr:iron-siderophore ABC transporter substrate-binding protein [Brenneria sp. L3-3C-1]MEE3642459.1 iron-siderophore ABC transporter substrate-binding protein [Brenneria sp. L3_3C_1]